VVLERFTSSGVLDTTFTNANSFNNGRVESSPNGLGGITQGDSAGVLIQSNGKIVVGETFNETQNGPSDLAPSRFSSNASLDTSFGSQGIALASFGAVSAATAYAIAATPDNTIVVAGNVFLNNGNHSLFALAEFTPSGNLNKSFGNNGVMSTDFSGFATATST